MLAKTRLKELQTLLEDKKDDTDMDSNTYMELTNKIAIVYNCIEEQEFIGLYYNIITEEYEGDTFEPIIKSCYTTLQLTDDDYFHGVETSDLREVLFYKRKIHRDLYRQLEQKVNSFEHHYNFSVPFVSGMEHNCGYTIFKVIELYSL